MPGARPDEVVGCALPARVAEVYDTVRFAVNGAGFDPTIGITVRPEAARTF